MSVQTDIVKKIFDLKREKEYEQLAQKALDQMTGTIIGDASFVPRMCTL